MHSSDTPRLFANRSFAASVTAMGISSLRGECVHFTATGTVDFLKYEVGSVTDCVRSSLSCV